MTLRIETFGGLRAMADGVELDWLAGQRLRAAVLTFLAVERKGSRDAMTALFWPESDADRARQTLRQTLYNLRQALGRTWLESNALEIRATAGLASDAMDFEAAAARGDFETATSLYAGRFLDAVYLLNLKPWEDWVDGKRAYYARLHRKCCRGRISELVAGNDTAGAIAAARRWVSPDPFDDEAQHKLLELLAGAGQRNEFLRQFDAYQKLLEADGLEPLDDTKALVESVRADTAVPPMLESEPPVGINAHADDRTGPENSESPWDTGESELSHSTKPDGTNGHDRSRFWRQNRRWVIAGVATLATLLFVWQFRDVVSRPPGPADDAAVDTARYVVFPLGDDSVLTPDFDETVMLQDAFRYWDGIRVVEHFQVREALERAGVQRPDRRRAREIARSLGAGRYVLADVHRAGNGAVTVSATLYDASLRTDPVEASITIAESGAGAAQQFASLAYNLLFPRGNRSAGVGPGYGSRSVPGVHAFDLGEDAITRWDLPAADSLFRAAADHDSEYAEALLRIATVGAWQSPGASPRWVGAAERAAARADRLTAPERDRASALLAQAHGDFGRACPLWKQLSELDPSSFADLYGYALCLRADPAVLPDPDTPGQYVFRANYNDALRAYRKALNLLPSMHATLSLEGFKPVLTFLFTRRGSLRDGVLDTMQFLAYPSFEGDSLAFHAFHLSDISRGVVPASSSAIDAAVKAQRRTFYEVATGWAATYPESAGASEAVGMALKLLGDPSAVDTLRKSRALAATPEDSLRTAGSELWVRLELTSREMGTFQAVKALADSLLAANARRILPLARTARLLGSLAELTGRADDAAAYAEAALGSEIPGALASIAPRLLAFAALGGPQDTLVRLEREFTTALRIHIDPQRAVPLRQEYLDRASLLALPATALESLSAPATDYWLVHAASAFLRDDTAGTRRWLDEGLEVRRRSGVPGSDVTMDMLVPEAWLRAQIGDTTDASHQIESALDQMFGRPPRQFLSTGRAASLVRAMILLADLHAGSGRSADAAFWARAVTILWEDADPFLQPEVQRMRRLAGSGARP